MVHVTGRHIFNGKGPSSKLVTPLNGNLKYLKGNGNDVLQNRRLGGFRKY